MRAWIFRNGPILLLVAAAFLILLPRPTALHLLDDSDTRVALAKIAERKDPWSWFTSDWPLENHFYRPISTLTLEFDQRLWPGSLRGFLFTNAVLALGCLLGLLWLLKELGWNRAECGLGGWLFFMWLLQPPLWFALLGFVWLVACVASTRTERTWTWTSLFFLPILVQEGSGIEALAGRALDWVPGRTATCATFFGLLALASWMACRRRPWWIVPSTGFLYLALGSYEQAIMVPFLMVGIAILFAIQKRAISPWFLLPPLACLAAYGLLRQSILPPGPSGYINQQVRSIGISWFALGDYLFPIHRDLTALKIRIETGAYALFDPMTWVSALRVISFGLVAAFVARCRKRWTILWAYLASVIAFLPMAYLKPFEHYHVLPMAMRAVFLAALIAALLNHTSPSRSKLSERIK